MGLVCVTPSTITPWLLDEAKAVLRQTNDDDDAIIQDLIFAVADFAEIITRRALFTSTWRYTCDEFAGHCIELPKPPLQSIVSVKYKDGSGALQILGNTSYQIDSERIPGLLKPGPNLIWPVTESERFGAVQIEFIAGWTTRGMLPRGLKRAMEYLLTHLYDLREPVIVGTVASRVPTSLSELFFPYRVLTFY